MDLFDSVLLILLSAVVISIFFIRLNFPTIIGYITVGILMGPNTFGVLKDIESTKQLAEFGLVFLMFTVGLQFSLTRLWLLKRIVFVGGGIQVLLCILCTLLVGYLIKMQVIESVVVGCVVAMSSTAIVIKQLSDQIELDSNHGTNAVGLLLFQDLAVIPILILMTSLSDFQLETLPTQLTWAILNGVTVVLLILAVGRWIMSPLFYHIAETRSLELFMISALFITLGAAWLTNFFGLSMVFGAFAAGIMLGETEFRHHIEVNIRPFRDVLLGLFFLSIGTFLNLSIVVSAWPWVLMLLFALIVFKSILISFLIYILQQGWQSGIRTGLVTGQGGEFGLAILTIATTQRLVPDDYAQVILAAILISMIIAPFIIRYNKAIAGFFSGEQITPILDPAFDVIHSEVETLKNHVILCGYGHVGQNIARFLEKAGIPYLGIDLDPSIVRSAVMAGEPVFHADASHYYILELARVNHAKAVVITLQGINSVKRILEQIRLVNKTIPIIVRSSHEQDTDLFYASGATEVIPESYEESLMFVSHILFFMEIPIKTVSEWIDESRRNQYDLLRMVYQGGSTFHFEQTEELPRSLQVVLLTKEAYAINRSIESLNLPLGVRISGIRRRGQRIIDPDVETVLLENDAVVLFGKSEELTQAISTILNGD